MATDDASAMNVNRSFVMRVMKCAMEGKIRHFDVFYKRQWSSKSIDCAEGRGNYSIVSSIIQLKSQTMSSITRWCPTCEEDVTDHANICTVCGTALQSSASVRVVPPELDQQVRAASQNLSSLLRDLRRDIQTTVNQTGDAVAQLQELASMQVAGGGGANGRRRHQKPWIPNKLALDREELPRRL